tara:strand:- start:317 stop:2377 length:2061 start_codon:yes stop_codon:yes gene_type:complete
MSLTKKNFLFNKVSQLKGVGSKTSDILKRRNIVYIKDLLMFFPYSSTDRSHSTSLDKLEIGKIFTLKVKVSKYNFPRIRNLPNRVICEDGKGKIELVFFNSREGYIRNVLPINKWVLVSGKVNFYKNKYQMTNPDYITKITNLDFVQKIIPKYKLVEGVTEKNYRKIIEQVLDKLPQIEEWHNEDFLKQMDFDRWDASLKKIHKVEDGIDINSTFYRRLAYDEIFAHLLTLSESRKRIKKGKQKIKKFTNKLYTKINNNLNFSLTKSQKKVIEEINLDLSSKNRMFRMLQGDVGCGKTIVSLMTMANVIESGFQCALMAPTSILAEQHYFEARNLFKNTKIKTALLTGKTSLSDRRNILNNLKSNNIDLIIGTHSLFQKKIIFNNLGMVVIDEQHKFGVRQRISLADKGGPECDLLLMSATPIPRTMMLGIYGDMDISKITEKPAGRAKVITYSKPSKKIEEIWKLLKIKIKEGNQIFWVCPLIEESKILNFTSAKKRFETIKKKFPGRVELIHGSIKQDEKEIILKKFKDKKIDILVSTTVIEVGIDFPNANVIIIDNANKFGLSQLHQLRGRVGRGNKPGICILVYNSSLSENATKRIKILKKTNDGFEISEEDLKLRGFGDLVGFEQSGFKLFKIADEVHHADLFELAKKNIDLINLKQINLKKFDVLLKIFDKAEIINNSIK